MLAASDCRSLSSLHLVVAILRIVKKIRKTHEGMMNTKKAAVIPRPEVR